MGRRKRRGVGDIHESLKIQSLGYGGVGVSELENGKKVLIKGALPDSVVDVRIVRKKKDYLLGHIVKVHEVDKKRLDGDAKCPHHLSPYSEGEHLPEHQYGCGGCKRQAVSYESQLQLKHEIVTGCFDGISGLEILPILGSPLVYGYRNKIEFSFGKYLKRKPPAEDGTKSKEFAVAEHRQMGFHKQGEFSKVIDIDQCYLVSAPMHEIYNKIKADIKNSGLPVHDAKSHQGLFRHLMVREGVHTGHLLVNLSFASKHFQEHPEDEQKRRTLLDSWKKDTKFQESATTFVLSDNNGLADVMRGPDTTHETLWGEGKIYEELHYPGGEVARFGISPASFFQTNTTGAELLFSTSADMLGEVKGNIIDLYCGGGSIGQCLLTLGKGKKVKGIEIVEAAIQDANYNAKINHLADRCDYYVGKAEKVVKQGVIDDDFFIGDDVVIVDPPREGMHGDVVKFLIQMKQQSKYRLCYISCNPTTMARDIKLLLESGLFSLSELQPVDMFPHTHHIECISILE